MLLQPTEFIFPLVERFLEKNVPIDATLHDDLARLTDGLRGFDERVGLCSVGGAYDISEQVVTHVGICLMSDEQFHLSADEIGRKVCRRLGIEPPNRDKHGLLVANFTDIIQITFLDWD